MKCAASLRPGATYQTPPRCEQTRGQPSGRLGSRISSGRGSTRIGAVPIRHGQCGANRSAVIPASNRLPIDLARGEARSGSCAPARSMQQPKSPSLARRRAAKILSGLRCLLGYPRIVVVVTEPRERQHRRTRQGEVEGSTPARFFWRTSSGSLLDRRQNWRRPDRTRPASPRTCCIIRSLFGSTARM